MKSPWTMVLVMALAISAAACGKKAPEGEGAAAATVTEPQPPAVAGEIKETEFFDILVPQGWEFVDFGKGSLQTYNRSGSYMAQVKLEGFNLNDNNVESALESMRARQDGSPLERVEMKGLNFWTTTFESGGRRQTFYNALKDGRTVSIAISGPDHQSDPTMQAVLESIVIK